jgi:hypothetical protein
MGRISAVTRSAGDKTMRCLTSCDRNLCKELKNMVALTGIEKVADHAPAVLAVLSGLEWVLQGCGTSSHPTLEGCGVISV